MFDHLSNRLPVVARCLRAVRYRLRLAGGNPGGEVRYRALAGQTYDPRHISVCCTLDKGNVQRWAHTQTLDSIEITDRDSPETGWFSAPGTTLPKVSPVWLRSALLVAATEQVDALTMSERVPTAPNFPPTSADHLMAEPWRALTLFSSLAYRWDRKTDTVQPRKKTVVAKVIAPGGIGSDPPRTNPGFPKRRGPYVGNQPLPATLTIGIHAHLPGDLLTEKRQRPNVLVSAPFLARGGAEHTLFETLAILRENCGLTFVTLAPHRPELHDRRDDFEALSPNVFSLGDWVHPDAMMPILLHLIDSLQVDVLYNANGTTLFYDFAPQLKRLRPNLRIVDHLYDHRVGYVERYRDAGLMSAIDSCIAENHPVAEVLTHDYGWPTGRVPVIWSCGRSPDDLPPPPSRDTIRRQLRDDLGFQDDDVVLITAARMHPQKRPLDLIRLAEAVADRLDIHFLIVGGGPMEEAVDLAISEVPACRIQRLPFRTDIPDLILASDAGLLVSDFEGLPVFMLECFQLGRPFVGTDVGDIGRVLNETRAGLIIDTPGDITALADAVRRLTDRGLRRDLGANALKAGARFSPQSCAAHYGRALFGDEWTTDH